VTRAHKDSLRSGRSAFAEALELQRKNKSSHRFRGAARGIALSVRPMRAVLWRLAHYGKTAVVLWLSLWLSTNVQADDQAGVARRSLMDLSIEELLNESVTSVSKKETKLNQSPAAISIITQDEIRRSGLTSIPELLRTVPGLEVARINGSQWAIGSRGFNNQYANKLLVLVDGRAVYSPTFGGVFWNAQDVVLEDVDRIEVIRGPGATLWGANAVNGVINITTKSAKETQGGMVSSSFGTEDQPSTTVRYGGQLATNLYYRAYVKYFNRDGLVDSNGRDTADDWSALRGGLRLDWEPSTENKLTLQGDYYGNEIGGNIYETTLRPPAFSRSENAVAQNSGGNTLGRWTRTFSDTAQLTLQGYYDHIRQEDNFTTVFQDTYDVDLQHRFALGTRNDVVWGVGYRLTQTEITPSFGVSATPEKRELPLYNVFVQDDLALVRDRLHLTFGSKFEHNAFTGLEIQPSGRLLWTPVEHQTVWAAVSRAVRTPTAGDRDIRSNFGAFQTSPVEPPVLMASFGNRRVESEELVSYELGYRIEPAKRLSFDVATFYNIYDGLVGYVQGTPRLEMNPTPHVLIPLAAKNSQSAETYGAELSARWQVMDHWRLAASYSWLQMHVKPDPRDEQNSPQHQFQLRSDIDLPHRFELNSALYFVDSIRSDSLQTSLPIAAYVRLDVGIVWRPTAKLEFGIWGQNLLDDRHAEFNSLRNPLRTEVPRSVIGKITWRF
jgi:iron complex outermembrane recepter protein